MRNKNIGTALFLIPSITGPIDATSFFEREEFSSRASTRIQLFPAFLAAKSFGLNPLVLALRAEEPDCLEKIENPKICLVGKLKTSKSEQPSVTIANLSALVRLKRRGVPIIVIYSDNNAFYSKDYSSELYRDLLGLADCVVCPSKALISQASSWILSTTKTMIIEDPCYIRRSPFSVLSPGGCCNIFWFGHITNVFYLFKQLPLIIEKSKPFMKFVLTIMGDEMTLELSEKFLEKIQIQKIPNWEYRFSNWSLDKFELELKSAHIVLLPSDTKSNIKKFASHNRAVDALQAGCMIVASPIPSYQELGKCMLLGEDIPLLLNEGIDQYSRLTGKWEKHRDSLLSRFSPETNISNWVNCYRKVLNSC